MSFAEKQLAKFGWKSGEGLGKNKDGIKKSISVTKKNDTKGLGGKLDKWDFAWWDHVFNKSAANIQVNKDESGEVKVEKQNPSDIQVSRMGIISTSRPAGPSRSLASTASSSSTMSSMVPRDEYADDDKEQEKHVPAAKSGPSWLFGFVKASASSTATEEAKKTNKDFTSSAESFAARTGADYEALKAAEGEEYRDYSVKVSDQELFEACEGRTARKGARGEQPGKLGRVTKELLIDDGSKKPSKTSKSGKKAKKDKKEVLEKKEKRSKKEKKSEKDKSGKENKEKKEKRLKKEAKVAKEKKVEVETEKRKGKKDKKDKKDKKEKGKEDKKSKKRSADEVEERPAKKSKKSKSE
ncbi:G patch domain-containing protein 4 [Mortierella sp. GBA30]|nr:G patch domain-containing protein 4 [Mortierella sp. GBA30]